jgi:hypothetical protein
MTSYGKKDEVTAKKTVVESIAFILDTNFHVKSYGT